MALSIYQQLETLHIHMNALIGYIYVYCHLHIRLHPKSQLINYVSNHHHRISINSSCSTGGIDDGKTDGPASQQCPQSEAEE